MLLAGTIAALLAAALTAGTLLRTAARNCQSVT